MTRLFKSTFTFDLALSIFAYEAREVGCTKRKKTEEVIHLSQMQNFVFQANAIAEHLCWQNYFKSKEAFGDWFEHFHRGKPVQPQLPDNPSFTDRAAHGEKSKQYAIDLERYYTKIFPKFMQ